MASDVPRRTARRTAPSACNRGFNSFHLCFAQQSETLGPGQALKGIDRFSHRNRAVLPLRMGKISSGAAGERGGRKGGEDAHVATAKGHVPGGRSRRHSDEAPPCRMRNRCSRTVEGSRRAPMAGVRSREISELLYRSSLNPRRSPSSCSRARLRVRCLADEVLQRTVHELIGPPPLDDAIQEERVSGSERYARNRTDSTGTEMVES